MNAEHYPDETADKAINNVSSLKWYSCPMCGKHLFKYAYGASAKGIFVWCKECRKGVEIEF